MSLRTHGDDRVDEYGKIGTRAESVEGIDCFRISVIEVSSTGSCEMSACRKTHDTDSLWATIPFTGPGTNGADGTLCIMKRNEWSSQGEPILEYYRQNTMVVEPTRNIMALRSRHKRAVPTARADDNRCAVGFRRVINSNKRVV